MSFNPQDCTSTLDSVSPFSSLDSDINSQALTQKLSEEKEKSRKLEERISGYKTVAQQLPKYQNQIKDLQTKNAEQRELIALLEKKIQESNSKGTQEEHGAQGLTDLAAPLSGHSEKNKSPSFEVLSPPGDSGRENNQIVHEKRTSPVTVSSSLLRSVSGSQESELPKSIQPKEEGLKLNTNTIQDIRSRQETVYQNSTARGSSFYQDTSLGLFGAHNIFYSPVDIPRHYPQFAQTVYRPVTTFEMSNVSSPPGKEFPGPLTYPAQAPSTTQGSYGVGAKPKEWAPLHIPQKKQKLFEYEQQAAASQATASEKLNTFFRTPESVATFQPGSNMMSALPLSHLNHQDTNQREPGVRSAGISDPQLLDTNVDLIKFHSVVLPPNEPSETNLLAFSENSKDVTFPSDDHHHLASQAESMAAILKSTHSPSGISEMLLEFSKEVGKLEAQLQEKQAQIQRQQVQIQSYTKNTNERELLQLMEENRGLKEENENLFAFIMTHSENQGQFVPLNEFRWLSVANQATGDMSKSTQPESPLIRKVETLEKINTKLFLANKDWYNKWEILRQSNQEKIQKLEERIESLLKEKESQLEITDELRKQLAAEKISNEQTQKKMTILEGEKINTQRFVESLRNDVELLTNEKRKLDAEIVSLKNMSRQRSKEENGNKVLEAEIALLKQQIAVFAEDFEKERQDRAAAESKADKMKKDRDRVKQSAEAKIKQLNSQFKNLEDTLRAKNRQVADLHVKIEDLQLQLHSSQRKAALAPQSAYNIHLPSSTYGPATHLFTGLESSLTGSAIPMASTSYNQQVNRPLRTGPGPPGLGPEHLAGAWTCKECTYINYPSRSVCDICGYRNITENEMSFETGVQELHSRGDTLQGFRDIETDTTPKV